MNKIIANPSGTRTIEVSDNHLETLRRYQLLDQLVGSNGIIDEGVLDKLKLTVRSILSNEGSSDKSLLDLCFDVIYHSNMKATGLSNLIALYRQWNQEHRDTEESTESAESTESSES